VVSCNSAKNSVTANVCANLGQFWVESVSKSDSSENCRFSSLVPGSAEFWGVLASSAVAVESGPSAHCRFSSLVPGSAEFWGVLGSSAVAVESGPSARASVTDWLGAPSRTATGGSCRTPNGLRDELRVNLKLNIVFNWKAPNTSSPSTRKSTIMINTHEKSTREILQMLH
jgi:hypothetical protein